MTDDLPTPVWSGEFQIFGVTLHCHVLSDGQRTIEANDVAALFAALFDAMEGNFDESETGLEEFERWMHGDG